MTKAKLHFVTDDMTDAQIDDLLVARSKGFDAICDWCGDPFDSAKGHGNAAVIGKPYCHYLCAHRAYVRRDQRRMWER